ncbi:hypothetical protein [Paenibacillus sp. Leaf72]|uniref:hypothetical protein n=1 Tax=Paenibacillus sp. Leaf72 TaxID=1736234 RepID=UPI0006FBD4D6|nr:hypothetical protein [Paenibacillus sp. Leaf72]KQO17261.1 hypothetical protein ASF12_00770 [Paenibacillus sp. Leaf72]
MASQVIPAPMDYAVLLAGAHPELSSPDPVIQTEVNSLINSQTNLLYGLATAISKQGPASSSGGWATIEQIGKLGTNAVYQYTLSSAITSAVGPLIEGTLVLVKQDDNLLNRLWSVQQGVTGAYQPVIPPAAGFQWTADNFQPQCGITVQSVSADPQSKQFQIVLQNSFPAFYSLYTEFLDASGALITLEAGEWTSRLQSGSPFETATLKFIGLVPPTLGIAGMPAAAQQTTQSFQIPSAAVSVRLTFGTLGALGWNSVANPLPFFFSAVLGYAVPWIMKSAGEYTSATAAWYYELFSDSGIVMELEKTAGILSSAVSTLDAINLLCAQTGKLLFGGSLPKLLAALRLKYKDDVLIQAAQSTYWPLAGMLSSLQSGAVSGVVETLSVPATFAQVYSMNMIVVSTVEVYPDPAHGTWPLTAASYTVKWTGNGDVQTESGLINGIWSDPLLKSSFANVPHNAAVSAQAFIYDASGALVGQGEASGIASSTLSIVIQENAPAAAAKGYRQTMALAFSPEAGFNWQPATEADPSTIASLDCSNVGTNLCQLTGISFNAAASALVYGWRASGQTCAPCSGGGAGAQMYRLQAISVSSSPAHSLKPASCGFYTMTTIAAGHNCDNNLFFDTRTEPYALRNIALGDAGVFQFPTGTCRGYLTLSTVDDLTAHPAGFAAAVSTAASMLQIVQLSAQPVADSAAPGPYSVGGVGTRPGLMQQPVAVAAAPDGTLIVLEAGNKRLQAFDVFGNSQNYFAMSPVLQLRQTSGISYIDLDIDVDGNMYVLSYSGGGNQASQYLLDVYSWQGALLSSTEGVNAAKIAVDEWRNLYALDYSLMQGPQGDTSPAIRVWTPITT